MLRIDDTTISGEGYRPAASRRPNALRCWPRSAGSTSRYLRAHPFKGTCPIAYDGRSRSTASAASRARCPCTYDLSRVEAVRLVEQLLGSLKPR